jgi:hypothetical protein
MEEILPGIWHWTAYHERIGVDVSSYFIEDAGALIDPMVPSDEGIEWLVERRPRRILLTNRHHYRHSDRIRARFGCPVLCHEAGLHEFEGGPHVDGFAFGDEVADGIVAREVGAICPEETALHIMRGPGAMSLADAVINEPGEGLAFVPDKYLGDDPEGVKRGLEASLRRLLEYDFDALLVGHGEPIPARGKAALATFVAP